MDAPSLVPSLTVTCSPLGAPASHHALQRVPEVSWGGRHPLSPLGSLGCSLSAGRGPRHHRQEVLARGRDGLIASALSSDKSPWKPATEVRGDRNQKAAKDSPAALELGSFPFSALVYTCCL